MKIRLFTAIAITAMAITSCSEDTGTIGSSITSDTDKLVFSTGTYQATSRSIMADSVYSKTFDCYFGKVKDPETNSYVKNEFMAQFNILEGFKLPEKSAMVNTDEAGEVVADSCTIWLLFNSDKCYGDSLTPMKVKVSELAKPVEDGSYYSNFNPAAEGYLRKGGLQKSTVFSTSYSSAHFADSLGYSSFARIPLNDPYTDQDGVEYPNYGTYILRQYYQHPEKFKNSYSFIHTLMPGFNFEVSDGLGAMAKVSEIDLEMYYTFKDDTTTYATSLYLSSTPEVLQTAHVENDKAALQRLIADNSCTYIKSPAGIFTEVTLPVDDISQSHVNDSLLSVSISFQRQNSGAQSSSQYPISTPANILMVQKDSLYSFFENKTMYDYNTSYMATLSTNAYNFSNIGNLITQMARLKAEGLKSDANWEAKHPDWNKVVLVPVATTTKVATSGYDQTPVVAGVHNDMGLSSTKLVGGAGSPIEVKVVYAQFKK